MCMCVCVCVLVVLVGGPAISAGRCAGSTRPTAGARATRLLDRAQAFQRGDWPLLLQQAWAGRRSPPHRGAEDAERCRHVVCVKSDREVSRAHHAAALAPGSESTWNALTPEHKPPTTRPTSLRNCPTSWPLWRSATRHAPRQRAGLSGMRPEHLKVLLVHAATSLAEPSCSRRCRTA